MLNEFDFDDSDVVDFFDEKNNIVLKNCSISNNNKKAILNNISLELPKGSLVLLHSSDKQMNEALTNLLFSLSKPSSGEILIDGININNFDIKTLRSKISYLNNYDPLFNLSIKDNIIGNNLHLNEEDITGVSKQLNLIDFVSNLPNGYDTMVNQKGLKFSDSQIMEIKFMIFL